MYLEQLIEGTIYDKYKTITGVNSTAQFKKSSQRKKGEISIDTDNIDIVNSMKKINKDDLVKYLLGVTTVSAASGLGTPAAIISAFLTAMLSKKVKSNTSDKDMIKFINTFEEAIHRAESEVPHLSTDKKKKRALKRIENAKKRLISMKIKYDMK